MHWPLQRHGLIFIFVLILFCKLSFLCLGAVAVSDKGMTSRHPLAANSTGFWSRSFRLYIFSWLLLIFLLLKSFFCFCRSRSSHSFCCCCYFAFESRAFHLCVSPSHIFVFALVFVFIFAFAFVFTFVFAFVFLFTFAFVFVFVFEPHHFLANLTRGSNRSHHQPSIEYEHENHFQRHQL